MSSIGRLCINILENISSKIKLSGICLLLRKNTLRFLKSMENLRKVNNFTADLGIALSEMRKMAPTNSQ